MALAQVSGLDRENDFHRTSYLRVQPVKRNGWLRRGRKPSTWGSAERMRGLHCEMAEAAQPTAATCLPRAAGESLHFATEPVEPKNARRHLAKQSRSRVWGPPRRHQADPRSVRTHSVISRRRMNHTAPLGDPILRRSVCRWAGVAVSCRATRAASTPSRAGPHPAGRSGRFDRVRRRLV
jgi:hypothetical protein